jgi:glyoxylase-like metal-dependent hydrolase (beta-lactamase superfamily II)
VYRVGRVVIDPASPWEDEQARTLEWVLASPTPVDTILLTHHHADHVGGVIALRDALRARAQERGGAPIRVLAHADSCLTFALDGTVTDGDVIATGERGDHATLTAFYTPGHADGHLVYAAPNGDVIAGDLVAGIGTILIAGAEGHLRTYLNSLRRMLPVAQRLYPAHGPDLPGESTLRQYLAHRQLRTDQVRAVLTPALRADPRALAERVYAGLPGVDPSIAALQVASILQWIHEEEEAHV